MRFFRCLALLIGVAACLAPVGSAATTRTYQIYGAQKLYAQTYFGAAFNSTEKGYWYAEIDHSALGSEPAAIQGGEFELTILKGSQVELDFTGGTLTPKTTVAGCATQSYGVDATLAGDGSVGRLVGTLTVFRYLIYGQCITLTSALSGSLAITSA